MKQLSPRESIKYSVKKTNATMSKLKVNVHKRHLYKIHVTLIYIFSACPPQNKLSKSDQNLSVKFRGLFCGEPETEGQVNFILAGKMQQQHEGGDVGGGHCGVRG